jgi:hypothetical protein
MGWWVRKAGGLAPFARTSDSIAQSPVYLAADKKNKTKYRGPSPFDNAQGQDDSFKSVKLGKSILNSL